MLLERIYSKCTNRTDNSQRKGCCACPDCPAVPNNIQRYHPRWGKIPHHFDRRLADRGGVGTRRCKAKLGSPSPCDCERLRIEAKFRGVGPNRFSIMILARVASAGRVFALRKYVFSGATKRKRRRRPWVIAHQGTARAG